MFTLICYFSIAFVNLCNLPWFPHPGFDRDEKTCPSCRTWQHGRGRTASGPERERGGKGSGESCILRNECLHSIQPSPPPPLSPSPCSSGSRITRFPHRCPRRPSRCKPSSESPSAAGGNGEAEAAAAAAAAAAGAGKSERAREPHCGGSTKSPAANTHYGLLQWQCPSTESLGNL